jgi:hypothetical protein
LRGGESHRRFVPGCPFPFLSTFTDVLSLADEAPYLLHDEKKEKEIGDSLANILARAKKGKLFSGRNVYITGGVAPDQATMARIVQACGGIVCTFPSLVSPVETDHSPLVKQVITKSLTKLHKKIGDDEDSLVISCANDRREWDKLAAAPIKKEIYAVEAVFVAVLHQDLKRGFTGANRYVFLLFFFLSLNEQH